MEMYTVARENNMSASECDGSMRSNAIKMKQILNIICKLYETFTSLHVCMLM